MSSPPAIPSMGLLACCICGSEADEFLFSRNTFRDFMTGVSFSSEPRGVLGVHL